MKFKTELHCHSGDVSACSKAPVELIIDRYTAAGYHTLVLTNHLSRFTYKNKEFDHSEDWDWTKKIDFFMYGYHHLKEAAGDRLHIILGCELRSNTDENDYQLYGVTEEFLRATPDIMNMSIKDLGPLCHEHGILLFQAHPFRNGMRIKKPDMLDGIEVVNGNLAAQSRNDIAYLWAQRYNLKMSAGSDFHGEKHETNTGIWTDHPITTREELMEVLNSGNYEIVTKDELLV